MAGLSNPRIPAQYVFATAWQASAGSAASTADALQWVCQSGSGLKRNSQRIDPQGSTGSQFDKIGSSREVATQPDGKFVMPASTRALSFFLESITAGQPTVVDGDITETGDDGSLLNTWALTGLRPGFNTEIDSSGLWKIYVTADADAPTGTDTTIDLYSDSSRTAKVATGTIVDGSVPGTVTLAEANSSGLSGTVTLASVPAGDDTDIVLSVGKITMNYALQYARFFTAWQDTGNELLRIVDCVVDSIKISAEDLGVVMAEITFLGKTYTNNATALSAATPEVNFLSFSDGVYQSDANGTPVTEFPMSFELTLKRKVTAYHGSSTTPQALISEGFEAISGKLSYKPTDAADTIFGTSIADTTEDGFTAIFTRSPQVLSITMDKVKWLQTEQPEFGENEINNWDLEFKVGERDDASVVPVLFTLEH